MPNTRVASQARQNAYCLPNSLQILKSHGLETVPTQTYGPFSDYIDLCDSLVQIHDEVYSRSLASTEEGVVLYFVQKASKGRPEAVISVAKIKSAEYLVLKLLRNTLLFALEEDQVPRYDSLFNGFIRELKTITKIAKNLAFTDTQFAELFSTAY